MLGEVEEFLTGARQAREPDRVLAARIAALAGPGEVLVSSTVKDLVVGSGVTFDERGAPPLKGVPGEWNLFAVASAGES